MPHLLMPRPVASSSQEEGSRRIAVVKWYSLAKGYGFARLPGDERDVFLHHSQLEHGHPPADGEEILIELGEGERGLFAAKIERAAAPAARN